MVLAVWLVTFSCTFLVMVSNNVAYGRGPHHPRSARSAHFAAQKDSEHLHYVPLRPRPGAPGIPQEVEPSPKLTEDSQLLHDKQHIKEDLGEWAADKEMTDQEMEFYYFKIHDFDNNSKLDGLELLQAIQHVLPSTESDSTTEDPHTNPNSQNENSVDSSKGNFLDLNQYQRKLKLEREKAEDLTYFAELIDQVLREDDLDQDGFLSYFEYASARQRSH